MIIDIHIGQEIKERVSNSDITTKDIKVFFRCTDEKLKRMYHSNHLRSDLLLKWSILLDFNFFQLYDLQFLSLKQKLRK